MHGCIHVSYPKCHMHKIDRLHDLPATVILDLNASYEYSYVRCVLSVMYFKKTVMFFMLRIIIM